MLSRLTTTATWYHCESTGIAEETVDAIVALSPGTVNSIVPLLFRNSVIELGLKTVPSVPPPGLYASVARTHITTV
jgi:hypothetical protein